MKQVLQNLQNGDVILEDVPAPKVRPGHVLVRTVRSLISIGTERMLNDFASAGYIGKAKRQPEKVKEVLVKAQTDGFVATYEAVKDKLEQPLPMGYCNVGEVIEVGTGVDGVLPGDLVASNGPHSEIVLLPKHLCAKVPDGVTPEAASFTVVGSIALHGIRLLQPTLGETVVVVGLGLIGQIACQLLQANGCQVIGLDHNPERVALAREFGVDAIATDDPVSYVQRNTNGIGADAVLITAATKSNQVISQAAQMARKRGRVVLTGVVGLELQRSDFYEKEITFQVSCSYGPGRYDPEYEKRGHDYPIGYVRWTEQRNFGAILRLLKNGGLKTESLVSKRAPFSDAKAVYAGLSKSDALGVVLEYGDNRSLDELLAGRVEIIAETKQSLSGSAIGFIGAGPFAQSKLLPLLKKAGADVATICTSSGVSGSIAARRFGVRHSVNDPDLLLEDPKIGAVVIATPHNTHAKFTMRAMRAGKHVFVEKPLTLTEHELDEIVELRSELTQHDSGTPYVMVGFNRRFAPMAKKMKEVVDKRTGPLFSTYLVNAGHIPADNPYQDPEVGGGRIIGEACHFIDYMMFLTGSRIVSVSALKMMDKMSFDTEDNVAINLAFADGSLGQINYIAKGSKRFPKERVTVMWDGKVAELDNYRYLRFFGCSERNSKALWQDKGHAGELVAFNNFLNGEGPEPISFEEIEHTMRATFASIRSMRSGGTKQSV